MLLKILSCLLTHFVWFYGLAFRFSPNALVVVSPLHLQLHLWSFRAFESAVPLTKQLILLKYEKY